VFETGGASIVGLQMWLVDYCDAMMFVIVCDESDMFILKHSVASQERLVELHHGVEVVRPKNNMGQLRGRYDLGRGIWGAHIEEKDGVSRKICV
jgi:hypothetical protein